MSQTEKSNNDALLQKKKDEFRQQMGLEVKKAMVEKITTIKKSKTKEEIWEGIQAANFDTIKDDAKTYNSSLIGMVEAMNQEAGNVGGILSKLNQQYDETELAMIDEAERLYKKASAELERVNKIPDTGWERFWGLKNKIKEAKQGLENAEAFRIETKKNVESHKTFRIQNGSIDESFNAYLTQSEALVEILSEVIAENLTEITKIDELRVFVNKLSKDTAQEIEMLFADMNKTENKLKKALQERADHVPGTEDAAQHEEKIGNLQREYSLTKTQHDTAVARHGSAERFVLESVAAITSMQEDTGMMKALQAGIEEDTKSRRVTYPAALQSIKTARVYEVASNSQKGSLKVDAFVTELWVKQFKVISDDANQRMLKNPEEVQKRYNLLASLVKIGEDNKAAMEKYRSIMKEGYDTMGLKAGPEVQSTEEQVKEETE